MHYSRVIFAAFACLLSLPVSAEESGRARLVADFATGSTVAPQFLSGFAQIGNRSVFVRLDNEYFPSLWVTDGTPEGTEALSVLCPPCYGAELLGSTGSIAFYRVSSAFPSPGEMRIWRTDGTAAGTFPLMVGFAAGGPASLQGGRLFFSACTRELGCELWSSDGSLAGTAPVGEVAPGPQGGGGIWDVAAFGDQAFLIAHVADGSTALWLAGPSSLKRLKETPRARQLLVSGRRAYFIAEDDGLEIWTSDGTASGTRPLTRFEARNPFGPPMKIIDGRLYFTGRNHGPGAELWSVGTRPESLLRLTSFSERWAYFTDIAKTGDEILFVARAAQNRQQLWTSKGDFRSTKPVEGCRGGCPSVESQLASVAKDQFVFFGRNRAGEGIWRTDGTAAGTLLLERTEPYHELAQATTAGGRALIEITSEYETGELWISDGTAAGTFFVANGGPNWSHYYGWGGSLLAGTANGQLLFPGLTEDEHEVLWRGSGSPAGSRPITQPFVVNSSYPKKLTPFGDLLLAQVCTATEWQMRAVSSTGTTPILTRPLEYCDSRASAPVVLPERAVFSLFDTQEGISVWGTDGTPEGTAALIPAASDDEPQNVVRFGDQAAIWVWVPDKNGLGQFGSQLWLTDGTPAGTHKLLDLPTATEMYYLTASGGKLYFYDVEFRDNGFVLRPWTSDGTLAGTLPLTQEAGTTPDFSFTAAGETVYFRFTPQDGPPEIWSTDGTPAGTRPAITAASGMVAPEALTAIDERLFFVGRRAADSDKRVLPWVSDGTDGGTVC